MVLLAGHSVKVKTRGVCFECTGKEMLRQSHNYKDAPACFENLMHTHTHTHTYTPTHIYTHTHAYIYTEEPTISDGADTTPESGGSSHNEDAATPPNITNPNATTSTTETGGRNPISDIADVVAVDGTGQDRGGSTDADARKGTLRCDAGSSRLCVSRIRDGDSDERWVCPTGNRTCDMCLADACVCCVHLHLQCCVWVEVRDDIACVCVCVTYMYDVCVWRCIDPLCYDECRHGCLIWKHIYIYV